MGFGFVKPCFVFLVQRKRRVSKNCSFYKVRLRKKTFYFCPVHFYFTALIVLNVYRSRGYWSLQFCVAIGNVLDSSRDLQLGDMVMKASSYFRDRFHWITLFVSCVFLQI